MNPVCIWNRAFRWLFAITTFFFVSQFHVKYAVNKEHQIETTYFGSQFYVQFQKTVTTFMQFQKTVTSFMCSFKKLSRVSCSFKKLSLLSCLVSKKNVTFVCSSGETIRHFAKKKTRLQGLNLTACKKTFYRVAKCWNSCQFTFFGRFSGTFFFLVQLFFKIAIFNQLFL